ncbi:MAG: ABC transporter permease subunit [Geminicoccaceae bacterium]
MTYTFQWGEALKHLPYLLEGAWLSLALAFLGFWGGALICPLRCRRQGLWRPAGLSDRRYHVVFFTNTPALVQIFFLFYALPEVGILLAPFTAVLIGLSSIPAPISPRSSGPASSRSGRPRSRRPRCWACRSAQIVRYVIVPHIAKTLFAPLSSFYIWLVLGTSMASIFGVEELTGRAINISTTNFRTIEVFSVTALIYIAITILASAVLALIGRYAFRVRAKIF